MKHLFSFVCSQKQTGDFELIEIEIEVSPQMVDLVDAMISACHMFQDEFGAFYNVTHIYIGRVM